MTDRLPTFAEQMRTYDRAMIVWRREMDRYKEGERPAPPPYPVRPHTAGPSYGAASSEDTSRG